VRDVASSPRPVEFMRNEAPIQTIMVSGLATRAASFSALRPSRLAILAKYLAPDLTSGVGTAGVL
jgi:hypothetical protein